jgi:non-homologous end joining protein Ku
VFDLMSRLQASLKENKGKGRAVRAARKGAAATEKPARAKRTKRKTA